MVKKQIHIVTAEANDLQTAVGLPSDLHLGTLLFDFSQYTGIYLVLTFHKMSLTLSPAIFYFRI